MQRIAGSLAGNGYDVLLVGRKKQGAPALQKMRFRQKRLNCFFSKGVFFYAEYNMRLFFFLLFQEADIICAIDLDTILPVYFAGIIKQKKHVYDAHELFTEQKEVITRPFIHKCWLRIEKFAVPKFTTGYTVNDFIAGELKKRYGVNYAVVRNMPRLSFLPARVEKKEKWLLYQGAVNEGRCFETLIPAMKNVDATLVICGTGNFFQQAVTLAAENHLEKKIIFKGNLSPADLVQFTPTAYIGITLFEAAGLNQYQSLANRFFDYIMAGVPQLCVNYPAYAAINQQYHIMYPIDNVSPESIASALNNLLTDDVLYEELRLNCLKARTILNWETEERRLLDIYKTL